MGGATAAAAETSPEIPLAFAETGKLATSCAALAEGVKVSVRNETASEQPISLVPEFKDEAGAVVPPEKVCGGLSVDVPATVKAGRETTATLSAQKGESELSGSLALFAAAGGVVRREVAVSSEAVAVPIKEAPLVESGTVRLTGSATGPIWIPVEAASEATVAAASAGEEVAKSPSEERVGVVSGKNGSAPVIYAGKRESLGASTEAVGLELDTDGLDPGAYSGSVDLDPGDKEKGKVTLEVKIAAYWWIAALLLLVGIGVSLILQRSSGRLSPRTRLRRRIGGLDKRSEELEGALQSKGEGKNWATFAIDREDLATQIKSDLESQLNDASKYVVFQIDKKVLESLEAAIVVVEAQIDLLKQIPEHAHDLERELDKLPSRPTGEKPSLDAEARKVLVGAELRADELKSRIEEIDARAKQVRTLLVLLDRLEDLRKARVELDPLGETALKALDKALDTTDRLLWTAETAEDLATAAGGIQETAKMAAGLAHELPEPIALPIYLFQAAYAEEPMIEVLKGPDGPSAPPELPAQPPAPTLDAGSIQDETTRAIVAQCFAVAIAAAVAMATGLAALYATNETWGSCWDLLAAGIWGLGVQASVSTLATTIDGVGALRRS
jgi:post-segregation antitoxin (ccd killing protein)